MMGYLGAADPTAGYYGESYPGDTPLPNWWDAGSGGDASFNGGGGGGGGTTSTSYGGSVDSWGSFFSNFPKFAGGVATIISSTQGKPYAQGPYGASGSYGSNPYGAASGIGATGGISTTTLLLIGLALVLFMKK